MKISTAVTETQSQQHIQPHLSQPKRGHVSKQSLYKIFNYVLYKLYTGCQWPALPIEHTVDGQPVMPYHHFREWSADGSLQRLFDASLVSARGELDLSELRLDGSHSVDKKGAKA